jgi:L-fuculose-phosphate aldolase
MYQTFDYVGAVIHAHPKKATILSCRPEPMEPLLDAMKKYGPIPVLPRHLKVDSPEFGEAIVEVFKATESSFKREGHAVFYPFHGVLVAAPTLDDAYDLLERMEFNAETVLFQHLLKR